MKSTALLQTSLAIAPLAFILTIGALAFAADAHEEREHRIDTGTHTVTVVSPVLGKVDDVSVVGVRIDPKAKWKLTKEYAAKLVVTCSDGVILRKTTQGISDAERWGDKGATFLVTFTGSAAGKARCRGQLEFAVCTDRECVPKKHELVWTVDVLSARQRNVN